MTLDVKIKDSEWTPEGALSHRACGRNDNEDKRNVFRCSDLQLNFGGVKVNNGQRRKVRSSRGDEPGAGGDQAEY